MKCARLAAHLLARALVRYVPTQVKRQPPATPTVEAWPGIEANGPTREAAWVVDLQATQ